MSDKTSDQAPAAAEAADEKHATVKWPIPERLLVDAKKDAPRELVAEIPRNRGDWTLDAELAVRYDDPIAFVNAMLSAEQFNTLRALKVTNNEVAELAEAMYAALGFSDSGESPASSD